MSMEQLKSSYETSFVDVSFFVEPGVWYELRVISAEPGRMVTTREVMNSIADYCEKHSLSGAMGIVIDDDADDDAEGGTPWSEDE